MEVCHEGNSDKRRILNELARCLKTVYVESSRSNNVHLTLNCPLVQCVDRSLQHGLLNLLHSYWPLVRSCSHAQTLETIDSWVGCQGSYRSKGKAWLLATLVEGSFLSYLQCVLSEPQALERHYAPHAILRDASSLLQLTSLLTGMESVNFLARETADGNHELNTYSCVEENVAAPAVRPMLELSLNGPPALQSTPMTSSMTSSLASPGDSGFTQLDSETDTASFSEIVLETDSSSMKENVAILPVDPCIEKTIGHSDPAEPMTVSDITNANTSSGPGNASSGSFQWPPPEDPDEIVYRRPKSKTGKVCYVKQQKRVSFHESTDSPSDNGNAHENFFAKETERLSKSFKTSASTLSRAVGDFSSFDYEQEGVEIAGDSSLLGNDGLDELSKNQSWCSKNTTYCGSDYDPCSVKPTIIRKANEKGSDKAPVDERGIPEGQEDPPHRFSLSLNAPDHTPMTASEQFRMLNGSSPVPSCSSLKPQVSTPRRVPSDYSAASPALSNPSVTSILSQTPSKACLVNRFLRSITEKKVHNCRAAAALAALNKRKSSARRLSLFISGVEPVNELSQELLDELEKEIGDFEASQNMLEVNHLLKNVTSNLHNFLHVKFDFLSNETVHKVFRVRDTSELRAPMLAVVTNQALHVISNKMLRQWFLSLSDLSSILVGPSAQWISLVCSEKSTHVAMLTSGSGDVSDFVSTVERMLRRKGRKALPAVSILNEEVFMIPQWLPIMQNERVHSYYIVHALEETPSLPCSPSGPSMSAHFMFKLHEKGSNSSWEPGFFVLKAGVLHVSSDEEEAPLFSIHLQGAKCCCVSLPSRPHTIEVNFLHIAAPDDRVANDWLVALQKSSLGVHEMDGSAQKLNIVCGSLFLTQNHLMLVNSFGIPKGDLEKLSKPVLRAFVSDVTSFRIGGRHSCWCIVEFSCREVLESSGDYVIFFSTSNDKVSFMERLQSLAPATKMNTLTLSEAEPFRQHCDKIAERLSADWNFEAFTSCGITFADFNSS